jgi:hypothetical protein
MGTIRTYGSYGHVSNWENILKKFKRRTNGLTKSTIPTYANEDSRLRQNLYFLLSTIIVTYIIKSIVIVIVLDVLLKWTSVYQSSISAA